MGNNQKHIEEMERLIAELTESKEKLEKSYREFEESKDKLVQSEKLAFAGRMAASVAHEIRNPITVISMAIHQLHNNLKTDDPNREYTDAIIKNIDRLNHLITEFVNCARPPQLKMRNRDINVILDSVINFIKVKTDEQNIKIIKNFDRNIPLARVDSEHLERAFLNVVLNAIESMPDGGNLTINTSQEHDSIVIKFLDTGKGIKEEDVIRIFDPFFSTKEKGMGLGLSVTYATIISHNGTIDVESSVGKGTTFTINLLLSSKK